VLPGLLEDTPLFAASVKTEAALRSVTALSPSTEIRRPDPFRVEVIIKDIHETLILED